MEKKKRNKKIYISLIALFVLLIGTMAFLERGSDTDYETESVDIEGTAAREIQNVECYLFMGVDKEKEEESIEGYSEHGQCDALYLFIINRNDDSYSILPVNRNTLMNVATIDEEGEVLGERELQVEFAHTTGDGEHLSCENVVNSVSSFIYGHSIDGYVALSLDSIEAINHAAGGVTVTVNDDFTDEDPSLVKGQTVKLTDSQAVSFVRGRIGVSDGTTENRISRQIQYIEGLRDALIQNAKEDSNFQEEFYDSLVEYTCTNLSEAQLTRIGKAMIEYEYKGTYEIEGSISEDDWGFTCFTADKQSKKEAMFALLYEEK